jgi:molybdate transport system substrate-binding protein
MASSGKHRPTTRIAPFPGDRYIHSGTTKRIRPMRRRPLLALPASLALAALPARADTGSPPATVFAAASLTDAMRALGEAWRTRGNPAPRISFAASSTLARQIEQGAPADIFASADEPWMDYVQQRGLILDGTRVSPLANALVLIAPAGQPMQPFTPGPGTSLAALLGANGRLATGDPSNVPVGKYAQAALRWIGQWDTLSPHLARADNVRSALLLVERGEAPLGIVYETDAAASRGVQVVGRFPAESHPPITYPFALTRRAAGNGQARAFLAFATGPDAVETYRRFGFALRTE